MTKPAPNTLFTCFTNEIGEDKGLVTMRVSAFPKVLDCASAHGKSKNFSAPVLYDYVHPDKGGKRIQEDDLDLFRSCRMSTAARGRLHKAYLEVQSNSGVVEDEWGIRRDWSVPDMVQMIQALDVDCRKQRKKK